MAKTIPLTFVDFNSGRYTPETVDEGSKKYTGPVNGMLFNAVSLIKFLGTEDDVPAIIKNALANGFMHSFAEAYDVFGEIAKFQSDDLEELATYEANFKKGFEAGVLSNWSVDTLMRKGLGFDNYQPIIFTEDEL